MNTSASYPVDWQRPDGRRPDQLRPIRFERRFTKFSTGSVLAHCGDTQVLCNVTVRPGVPKFLEGTGQGWLTAEYRMLPGATPKRQEREFLKLSGRTQEIQRLIGRSLRSVLDLKALGEVTLMVDADVIQADAGTRTTAINGSFVALQDAVAQLMGDEDLGREWAQKMEPLRSGSAEFGRSPLCHEVAAVSVGLVAGKPMLDLNYEEDVAADVDLNVVMNEALELIEIQGTAESGSFSRTQLNQLIDLAEMGIQRVFQIQRDIRQGDRPPVLTEQSPSQ